MTERHIALYKDDNGTDRYMYWAIRKNTLSLNLRVVPPEDLVGNGEYAKNIVQSFMRSIAGLIGRHYPRTVMRIRRPNLLEFKFKDHGNLRLVNKRFLASKNATCIR